MEYIITGTYANGDEYGDKLRSIEQLTEALQWIAGHDHDGTPDHYRVLSESIKIETEEA